MVVCLELLSCLAQSGSWGRGLCQSVQEGFARLGVADCIDPPQDGCWGEGDDGRRVGMRWRADARRERRLPAGVSGRRRVRRGGLAMVRAELSAVGVTGCERTVGRGSRGRFHAALMNEGGALMGR